MNRLFHPYKTNPISQIKSPFLYFLCRYMPSRKSNFSDWLRRKYGRSNRRNFDSLQGRFNLWHSIPLVRLCIPLITGILLFEAVEISLEFLYILSGGLLLVLLLDILVMRLFSYRWRWIPGLSVLLLISCLGYLLTYHHDQRHEADYFSQLATKDVYVQATLNETTSKRKSTYRAIANVEQVLVNGSWQKSSGMLLLYVADNEASAKLKYGQTLLFKLDAQSVKPPLNPFEFDFQKYMQRKNIYFQQYLKSKSWKVVESGKGVWWKNIAYYLKEKIMAAYMQYIPSRSQAGVASALIFGYRDELDPDLVQAYAHTGTLHVLAVSGLHVGIIYVVLKWLFGWLKRKRSSRVLRTVFILSALWFYALLTGFSPSVNRAAFMFSFIVIAESLKRKTSIYTSIGGSAFILLLTDPLLIYDVGFQLSFSAVLGIIFLHTHIFDLWQPKTIFMNQVWNITCVSFAAQAATCAMGFYYFHQFPNYFLISNLLIIPASTLITYMGIILLALLPVPILATGAGILLDWLIQAANWVVYAIDSIPFSTFNGLTVSLPGAVAIFGILLSLVLFFFYQRKQAVWVALGCSLFLATNKTLERMRYVNQHEAWIYAMPGHTAISVLQGNRAVMLADSGLFAEPKPLNIRTEQHGWYTHVGSFKLLPLQQDMTSTTMVVNQNLLVLGSKKIYLLNKKVSQELNHELDALVLASSPKMSLKEIYKKFRFKQLIADQSNSRYRLNKWKAEAKATGLKVHFVDEAGAYKIEL